MSKNILFFFIATFNQRGVSFCWSDTNRKRVSKRHTLYRQLLTFDTILLKDEPGVSSCDTLCIISYTPI